MRPLLPALLTALCACPRTPGSPVAHVVVDGVAPSAIDVGGSAVVSWHVDVGGDYVVFSDSAAVLRGQAPAGQAQQSTLDGKTLGMGTHAGAVVVFIKDGAPARADFSLTVNAATGSTGSTGTTGTTGNVLVTITPSTAPLYCGEPATFQATVTGSSDTAVTWSVQEANGGSIDQAGNYLAGPSGGNFHVIATAHADASKSGSATVTLTPVPVSSLVAVGNVPAETGVPGQSHVFYAVADAAWWLMYIDSLSPSTLKTMRSTDFVNWTPSSTVTLSHPHFSEGRNLAVAYKQIAGTDVVHSSVSMLANVSPGVRWRDHIRATIAAGAMTFGAPQGALGATNADGYLADGSAVAILENETVIDCTGYDNTDAIPMTACHANPAFGDMAVYESSAVDSGASSQVITFTGDGLWCDQGTIGVRQEVVDHDELFTLGMADQSSGGHTIYATTRTGALSYTGPVPLFVASGSAQDDDWMGAFYNGKLHVVRRNSGGGYDHVLYDGLSITPGGAIPAFAGVADSGLVLFNHRSKLALVAIGQDAGNTLHVSLFDGASWSAWQAIVGGSASKRFLSGFSDGTRVTLIWTVTDTGTTYHVEGTFLP